MNKPDFDKYIEDSRYEELIQEATCAKCGATWEATMYSEYGFGWEFKFEDDAVCPDCGYNDMTGEYENE